MGKDVDERDLNAHARHRFMVIDGRLDKSPAQYVRRPRVSADSQALGLDRMHSGRWSRSPAAPGRWTPL